MSIQLKQAHPRLTLNDALLVEVKQRIVDDQFSAGLADLLRHFADQFAAGQTVVYELEGRRLLGPCRTALRRILFLSLAYRLWGEQRYLDHVIAEVEAACAIDSWNPSHFLDVAELSTALAYAYDWLFDELSTELKTKMRETLKSHAFEPGYGEFHHWQRVTNNWCQVCHGGMLLAAMAIGDEEPELLEKAYESAMKHLPKAIAHSYAPAGVYPEGPMYWDYGTMYSVLMYDAMRSALGKDSATSLVSLPGFLESAYYRMQMLGPDNQFYSFSDCGRGGSISTPMHWCAREIGDQRLTVALQNSEREFFDNIRSAKREIQIPRTLPLALLWAGRATEAEALPAAFIGQGPNPVFSFRQRVDNGSDVWLAGKGGSLTVGHCQMDGGSFIYYANGVRWSDDLGGDGYHALETEFGRETLWQTAPPRFNFFRLGLQGHSTLCLDDAQHAITDSVSPMYFTDANQRRVLIDLSKAWREHAQRVQRGLHLDAFGTLLVQDEIVGAQKIIEWNMLSVDDIEIDGGHAILRKDGQECHVHIHEPTSATFVKQSAKPDNDVERQNEGYARLCIRLAVTDTEHRIRVQMSPVREHAVQSLDLPETLDQWQEPEQ